MAAKKKRPATKGASVQKVQKPRKAAAAKPTKARAAKAPAAKASAAKAPPATGGGLVYTSALRELLARRLGR